MYNLREAFSLKGLRDKKNPSIIFQNHNAEIAKLPGRNGKQFTFLNKQKQCTSRAETW